MKHSVRLAVLSTLATLSAAPAFAAPETFVIDNNHTFPRFEYSHFGYSTQQSRFNKTSGTITLDRAAKSGTIDVSIDAKSVDTGSELFDGHIQAEDFFHTEKYPNIIFKSTGMKFDGEKLAAVDGNLTIKGITKPVTLDVTVNGGGEHPMAKVPAAGFDATTTLKRSDFGVGAYAPNVSDEVKIRITTEATGEKPAA